MRVSRGLKYRNEEPQYLIGIVRFAGHDEQI